MVINETQQPPLMDSSANPTPLQSPSLASTDRRRPGRGDYSNPALVELLRAPSGIKPAEQEEVRDDLAAPKGILLGLLIVIPFWAIVGFLVWYF